MERKAITEILGEEVGAEKVSQLLNLFHEENKQQKELFDTQKRRANEAETMVKEMQAKLEDLEKKAGVLEEKDKEIAGYLNEIADLKTQNQLTEIDSYETIKLMEAGAFDVDLCKKALDYDRKSVSSKDDYSVIDQAIKDQVEHRKFLFKSEEASKTPEPVAEEKKKPVYEPRQGNEGGKQGQSIGSQMAQELMSGSYLGINIGD